MVKPRCAQLLQRRVGQLDLPFVTRGPKNAETVRGSDRLLDQGRLADARFSEHGDRPATAVLRRSEQPIELTSLSAPTKQHRSPPPNVQRTEPTKATSGIRSGPWSRPLLPCSLRGPVPRWPGDKGLPRFPFRVRSSPETASRSSA